MRVSVVIPVYNASSFLESAVQSALAQEDTAEIILVEDGSADGSLDVCNRLGEAFEAVAVVRHPDGENHGAGASRNLGIRSASSDFIAFLDADDLYLPDRFRTAEAVFTEYPAADGVYEATGAKFEDDSAEKKWREFGEPDITTVSSRVGPGELPDLFLSGSGGTIHLDALTVKRSIFEKSGYFPENLRLHQDTAMIVKMALTAELYPGDIETPVAMRRIHSGNRFVSDYNRCRTNYILWKTLFRWAPRDRIGRVRSARLFLMYLYYTWCLASGRHHSDPPQAGKLLEFLSQTLCHPLLAAGAAKAHLLMKRSG